MLRAREMRHLRTLSAAAFALVALAPSAASAHDTSESHAHEDPPAPTVPKDLDRLILDTGRPVVRKAEDDVVRLQAHGEYQLRYQAMRSLLLTPTTSAINAKPGLVADSLGQNQFVTHWLRLTPRLQVKESIEVVGQLDVVTGLAMGDTAHDTGADQTPRDEINGFKNIQPRWLYADFRTPIGLIRVGQQPSHWGLGILANDGDHPTLFGDYRYGAINERILFATKPGGKDSDFTVALAGDLVYRDNTARLTRGDHAFQGVAALLWEHGPASVGAYGVYRNQTHDRESGAAYNPYTDKIEVGVVDLTAKVATPVFDTGIHAFAAAEAAFIFGSTNVIRTADLMNAGEKTKVRSYGGAMQLGAVHTSRASKRLGFSDEGARQRDMITYGDLVVQLEIGYATGDADPYDDTQRRFLFDPNHKVGLVLFDEVMRWQTARASTAATDPLLTNGGRPTPGADLLPTNGGVSGAQYINPTAIVRPRPWLDVKGGLLIAQATADVVDPYLVATSGSYVNSRRGDPKKRDYGVEADLGVEARLPLDYGMVFNVGAQAGVLFPGAALEDQTGEALKTPWLAIGRAGLLF